MTDYPSISKQNPPFPAYLDFQVLRQIGIEHVQALSSQLWTDYNLHDPGVTILEVLCYAVTDLGYRNNLDITDLLTLNSADPNSKETNFFTPNEILTCNPVTELDWRKRLIDIPGVRNAWLERLDMTEPQSTARKKMENAYEPAFYADVANGRLQYTLPVGQTKDKALPINPKGLYRVCLDLEPDRRKDACGQIYSSWVDILNEVKAVLCRYRNLCEDFHDVVILGEEEIAICTDIELEVGADPEDVQVEIYVRVQEFLAPRLRFYSLQELLSQGKSLADSLAGRPSALHDAGTIYTSHGFIDIDDLAALEPPKMLHTSDLYQIIMGVPGVRAIKKLSIINYINGLRQSEGDSWCLYLTDKHRPVLGLTQSRVTFFKGDLPFEADTDEVERRYYEQQSAYIKAPRDASELDLPVPRGSYFDLADHHSIHHDFPLAYGVGEDGLPDTAPPLRKAQAKQLKGYLIFFDQVLANYLAQLAHVRELFSWERETDRPQPDDSGQPHQRTYFAQALTNVPTVQEIIRNYHRCSGSDSPREGLEESSDFIDYLTWLESIREDPATYRDRRNRFLDHLLARFAETFTDYVLLNYRMDGGRRDEMVIIDDKARFLQKYPALSRDRFRSFNYCDCNTETNPLWNTNNVSGFQKRVSQLLGTDIDALTKDKEKKFWRRSLSHYEVMPNDETLFPGNTFEIALRWSLEASPLKGKQTYPTLTAARAALESFLEAALNPAHYRRLSYRYYYHYRWAVVDRQGNSLVTYDRTFSSQTERNAVLKPLVNVLKAVLDAIGTGESSTSTAAKYIHITRDDEGFYHFKLRISIGDPEPPLESSQQFTGIPRYVNEEDARVAAQTALTQIADQKAYQKSRVRQDDTAERGAGTPEQFTHYGYGLIDATGILLAESSDRIATATGRDAALQSWLSRLQANQNSVWVEPSTDCFFFEVHNHAGDCTLLRGLDGVPTRKQAEDRVTRVLSDGKSRSAYRLLDEPDFSFVLHLDGDDRFAQHPHHYATDIERDLRLDALLYYLNHPTPVSRIAGETGTYCATLLDREGNPLLITYHTYSTQSQAEAAYQRLLHLASDPVYFQPMNDLPGELSYGFELVDRRGNTFATHTQSYGTACHRDLVIRSIVNYINEDIDRRLVNRASGVYYELIDQADSPLLVGAIAYSDETAVNAAFDQMLSLSRDRANYQLIDNAAGHCPYSFALYEGSTLLASHPDHYDTAAERDWALQALINLVISDEPLYRIDGADGQFTYALVDSLAATENPPDLLTSAATYPDAEAAQLAFTQMLSHAALTECYQRLDNLPAPQSFGFELLDEAGELIARHLNSDGTPLGYATEAEREAAIEKIIGYAAQAEIQYSIVNPQGAFFAEIWEDGGDRLWMIRQTFLDWSIADAKAARIRTLARQPERYLLINTGLASRPYAFALTDETDEVIADYPYVYATEADRDCQIQRLRRHYEQGGDRLWIGQRTFSDQVAAANEADRICILARQPERYTIDRGVGTCPYTFSLKDETGEVIANHPGMYKTEADCNRQIQQLWRRFSGPAAFVQIQETATSRFTFEIPAKLFCLFQTCTAEQQQAFQTGSILSSTRGETFATAAAATAAFLQRLPLVLDGQNIVREYGNAACEFTFDLTETDPTTKTKTVVATSHPRIYRSRAEMEQAIAFIQQIALGLTITPATPGTCCGYYFFVAIPDATDTPLKSLTRYPTEERAWQAAGTFAEHLRYRRRYISPAVDTTGQSSGLGITDRAGHLLATSAGERDIDRVFRQLNSVDPFLHNEPIPGGSESETPSYRFRLVDRTESGLLVGTQAQPDEETARTHFYRDVLSILLEPGAIERTATNAGAPFSFRVVSLPAAPEAPVNVLATHPPTYASEAQRDRAIAHLFLLLRTARLIAEVSTRPPAYTGKIDDAVGQTLLQGTERFEIRGEAWEHGNTLVELAQATPNFRLIDDEDGSCLYSWELTNEGKDRILGVPPHSFSSVEERDKAIAILQARINDEGFHVVEHILLRPKHPPPEPVCSFALDERLLDAVTSQNALSFLANLTVENGIEGFSFTVEDEQGEVLFLSQSFSTRSERDRVMELMMLSGLPEEATGQPTVDRYETQRNRQGHSFVFKGDCDRPIGQSRSFASLPELEVQKQWLQTNLHKFAPQFGIGGDRLKQWQAQQEPRDNYDLTQTSKTGRAGFERFLNRERDRYYFHVNDCRGNALFYSEAYSGKAVRDKGVRSVIRNSIIEEHYTLKKIPSCDRTVYFFTLRAANGQEIGRSRYFDELWKLEACLDWFKHNVHQSAKEFNIDLTVPERFIEPKAIADGFLPITKVSPSETAPCSAAYDPYSFWISVVLPYWPARFRDMNFRRLVERTLRLEAPAHVALKICWVDVFQMHEFEEAYRQWLEQLNLDACQNAACDLTTSLNRLIAILSQLNNIYPEGTLHDCDESGPDDNPIVLNQTALGTANE